MSSLQPQPAAEGFCDTYAGAFRYVKGRSVQFRRAYLPEIITTVMVGWCLLCQGIGQLRPSGQLDGSMPACAAVIASFRLGNRRYELPSCGGICKDLRGYC